MRELQNIVKEATGSDVAISSLADAQLALQADMTQTLDQLEEVMVALGGSLIQQTDTFESAIFQMTDTIDGTLRGIDSFLKDALQGMANEMAKITPSLVGGDNYITSLTSLSAGIDSPSPALTQQVTPSAVSASLSAISSEPAGGTASLSDITNAPTRSNNSPTEINIYITEKVDKAVVEQEIIPVIEQATGRNGQVKLA